jgi:putative DNA primase/helicase
MELREFLSKLDGVEPYGHGQFAARCPAPGHPDVKPSLTIHAGKQGGVVIKCQRGCETKDVVAGLGLTLADLMGEPYCVTEYPYEDGDGRTLYTVERWANPKTFRVRPGLPAPAQRVLFQLDAIAWCRRSDFPIYVVEGERDCETLRLKGIAATCNVGGANKWLPHYNDMLAGLDVIVVADNDEPGVQSARTIAGELRHTAKSVTLKHSPIGSDVTDLVEAGYTVDALQDLPMDGAAYYHADLIQARTVTWAWNGYIPFGKVTFIEGDPGDGKSMLTLDLVARFTTGTAMPDGSSGTDPFMVAVVSAEDDPADTIVPRLVAAGANLERVVLVPHGPTPDLPFELARDIPWLRDFCVARGIKVVVFDPVNAFLTERTDTHNDSSTRRGLMPLKTLAAITGAAVLGVRHLNKGGAGIKAIYRSGGSIAFVGMARAAFLVAPKPTEPDVRVMACVKMSVARKPPTLTYTIEQNDQGHPYLSWGAAIEATAQDILDGPEHPEESDPEEEAGKRRARVEERRFLFDLLADGPMAWTDIVAAGKTEGFSARTLERARVEVSFVESVRLSIDDGAGGKTVRTVWQRVPEWTSTESNQGSPLLHKATTPGAQETSQSAGAVANWLHTESPEPQNAEQVSRFFAPITESDENPGDDGSTLPLSQQEGWSPVPVEKWPSGQVPEDGNSACSICGDGDNLTLHERFGWRCAEHHPTNRGEDL